MGVGRGDRNLKTLARKAVFLVLSGEKTNLTTLAPLQKLSEKSTTAPPG